jgi:CSLREA domain-containing protein
MKPIPRILTAAFLIFACIALAAPASRVSAAGFSVTKFTDSNDDACNSDCSLREAVIAANVSPGADTITLAAGTYVLSLAGYDAAAALGALDITGPLTLSGQGAGQTIIEAAGIIDGVFTLQTTRGWVTFVPLPRLVFPTWRPPFLRRQRSRRCNFQRDPTCLVPSSPWPMLVTRPPARLPGAIPGSADGRSLEKDIGLAGPARRHQSAGSRGCHSVHPGCLVWVVPFRPNEVL